MGLTYKKVGSLSREVNKFENLLQRQVAGEHYINLLDSGKIILNIDETVIRITDARQHGWFKPYQKTQTSLA
jgi:hypothetical protein